VFMLSYSFICQDTSTRRQQVTFPVFEQAVTCYYQSNHSKLEAILLSALSKDTISELASLSPY